MSAFPLPPLSLPADIIAKQQCIFAGAIHQYPSPSSLGIVIT